MDIVFASNYFNHHQFYWCNELAKRPDVNFYFIATQPVPKSRISFGYKDLNQCDYVVRTYESNELMELGEKLCRECDVLILGAAPEKYAEYRISKNKLLIRYQERLFRKGWIHAFSPRAIYNIHKIHKKNQDKNVFLLCAGAYVLYDFAKMNVYRNKAYTWGYFPKTQRDRNLEDILAHKEDNSILWCGRLIGLKHPEYAIEVAKRLKKDNIDFHLKFVGSGELREKLENEVKECNLSEYIEFIGAVSSDKTHEYMEKSDIFLFTSDHNEGWGAVLNESMNGACAVVASHSIGASPILISNTENGYIFENGNVDELYEITRELLLDKQKRRKVQTKAFETIINEWNPEVAAERLVELICDLLTFNESSRYEQGPCSKAKTIKPNWYKRINND